MATTTRYQEGSYKLEESELLKPLRDRSIIRKIYPIKTIAQPEDLIAYYYTIKDDFNLAYTPEPYDTPTSDQAITKTSVEIPVLHGECHWGYDELKRIDRSKLPSDERVRAMMNQFNLDEEQICLAGSSAPQSAVTSVSNTGTNSTAASTELNVTTIALITTSLTDMIGQLIDGNIPISETPLKLVVTPDVWKKAMGVLDTNQSYTGLSQIRKILRENGGPGSEVVSSTYLGATITRNAKKNQKTAGTTNACLFAKDSQYYEVIASGFDVRTDGVSKLNGMTQKVVERWIPVYKEKKGIIYSGTAVIA